MKKNIYITSLLCGWMAFATTSCEDPGEVHFDDDSFSSTLYLKDNGLQEVDFYNVNKDLIFSTIVGKGGTDNDIARTAAVRLFTQEEMGVITYCYRRTAMSSTNNMRSKQA